jgi:hypothetical protein
VSPLRRVFSIISRALVVAAAPCWLNPKMRDAGDVEVGGGHALLDHLVGADEERSRHLDIVRFCGRQN